MVKIAQPASYARWAYSDAIHLVKFRAITFSLKGSLFVSFASTFRFTFFRSLAKMGDSEVSITTLQSHAHFLFVCPSQEISGCRERKHNPVSQPLRVTYYFCICISEFWATLKGWWKKIRFYFSVCNCYTGVHIERNPHFLEHALTSLHKYTTWSWNEDGAICTELPEKWRKKKKKIN